MDWPRIRWIVILIGLGGVGCTADSPELVRLLQHRMIDGDTVGGLSLSVRVTAAPRWTADERPTFWLEPAPTERPLGWRAWTARPEGLPDYVPDVVADGMLLWTRPDPVAFTTGGVDRASLEWDVLDPNILGPVETLAWSSRRGEWVAEAVIQLPERGPRDLCMALQVGATKTDLGPVFQGRPGYFPGANSRPAIRHRIWAAGIEWSELSGQLTLTDCSSELLVAKRVVSKPSVEQTLTGSGLTRVWAPAPATGSWPEPDRGSRGLRRTLEGVKAVPGPPYPRLRQGEVWPVLVVGPVDPSVWSTKDMGTVDGPLIKAGSWLAGPGLTVVDWNAPSTRVGPTQWPLLSSGDSPRRTVPEWFGVLKAAGVDAVTLNGDHVLDAGETGAAQTRRNAASFGVAVIGGLEQPHWFTYHIKGELRLGALVSVDVPLSSTGESLEMRERLKRLGGSVDALLVRVNWRKEAGSVRVLADALAMDEVDALWFAGTDDWGAVDVRGSTVVVLGVPEGGGSTQRGAIRFGLGDQGVLRLDLLALSQNTVGQWTRSTAQEAAPWFERLSQMSQRFGTYLRTGQTIATVDVSAHWPQKSADERISRVLPALSPVPKRASVTLPNRCVAPAAEGEPVALGPNLHLVSWSWAVGNSRGDRPYVLKLQWAKNGTGPPLGPGTIEVKGAFSGAAFRSRHEPCDGSWGFEKFEADQLVTEEVRFWPPDGAEPGEADVWLTVHLKDTVQRTVTGDRRVPLGKIRLEKGQEPG